MRGVNEDFLLIVELYQLVIRCNVGDNYFYRFVIPLTFLDLFVHFLKVFVTVLLLRAFVDNLIVQLLNLLKR